MDLLYFIKILFKKKWLILGLSFVAMLATFTLKLFQKPLYESKAQYSTGFTIDRVKIAEGSPVADLYAADTKFDNVIETFKSPRVIGMISYRLLLHDLENPGNSWHKLSEKEKQDDKFKAIKVDTVIRILNDKVSHNELLRSDIPKERKILEFIEMYGYDYSTILQNLFIVRVNRTDYLDIVYRSENPYLSAWIVNAMGSEFINYYKNLSFQRTNENIENIQELERQQQEKIDSLNIRLLAEKISQGSIDPASLSSSAMETVKDLEGKMATEKSIYELNNNRIIYYQDELENLKKSAGTTSTSTSELLDLIDQKNKLEAQLFAKGGNDPAIQQQLSTLRTKIISRSSQGTTTMKNADKIALIQDQINEATAYKNAAAATMKDYESRIRYYQGLTRISPGSGVKMEVIKSKLDIEQKQLSNLKEKLNQAQGLSKDDPTSNFTQTLIGQPAVEPEPKKTITTTAIAGMSMFFLVCFALLFIEVFNASIKTPFNFEKIVKFPLLNIINNIKLKPALLSDLILKEDRKNNAKEVLFKNNIRKLRHEILTSNNKIFLFTSTASGTGKSLIIEALAKSLVLLRKRVLIFDFNLHHNTLTERFNAEITIQQVAEKVNMALPVNIQNVTSPTEVDEIHIIGCNKTSESPNEILFRFDFENFMNNMSENFDYIFIESPALNKYSDTKELVRYADKVITVFSAEQVYSQTDKISLQYVRTLREKSMGAILNNVFSENINY